MIRGIIKSGTVVKIDPNIKWKNGYQRNSGKEFEAREYVSNVHGRYILSPFKAFGNQRNHNGYAIYEQSELIYVSGPEPELKRNGKATWSFLKFVLFMFCSMYWICSLLMVIQTLTGTFHPIVGFLGSGLLLLLSWIIKKIVKPTKKVKNHEAC